MVIGFVETPLTVSETASGVVLEIQVLEGSIAPDLGSVVVTATSRDGSASGEPVYRSHSLCALLSWWYQQK